MTQPDSNNHGGPAEYSMAARSYCCRAARGYTESREQAKQAAIAFWCKLHGLLHMQSTSWAPGWQAQVLLFCFHVVTLTYLYSGSVQHSHLHAGSTTLQAAEANVLPCEAALTPQSLYICTVMRASPIVS